jgi:predicted nucleotidyltransferase
MKGRAARRLDFGGRVEDLAQTPTSLVPPSLFEGQHVPEEVFTRVLGEAVRAIEDAGIPYGALGGVASAVLGRPRWTHDADLFVRPADASKTLDALAEAGFATQRTNPQWLFKGVKDGVLVDILFRARGDIYLDDEMISRLVPASFQGVPLKTIPPEDLLVIKAIIHDEETPRHWNDALALIAAGNLDWDYVLRRARHGARRVLSLLIYAESKDIVVPDAVICTLFDRVYGADDEISDG